MARERDFCNTLRKDTSGKRRLPEGREGWNQTTPIQHVRWICLALWCLGWSPVLGEMPTWVSRDGANATGATGGPETAQWRETLEEGWRDSKATGLPMLIFITSENCIYCDAMEKNTWCSEEVRRELGGRFIPIRLKQHRNQNTLSRVKVKMYPTTVLATPAGRVVDHRKGFQPPERIKQLLDRLPRGANLTHRGS